MYEEYYLSRRRAKKQKRNGGNLLLDLHPAESAYSIFRLRSDYVGSCMRIMRSSDNAVLDIGFVNDKIDTASAASFCGTGHGYVMRIYDQMGNATYFSPSANADESTYPRLISNGVLNTLYGQPCVKTVASSEGGLRLDNDRSDVFAVAHKNETPSTFFFVKHISNPARYFLTTSGDNAAERAGFDIKGGEVQISNGSAYMYEATKSWSLSSSVLRVRTCVIDLSASQQNQFPCYENGVFVSSGTNSQTATPRNVISNTQTSLLSRFAGKLSEADYSFCELIGYKSDQRANREAIESNITERFNNN